MWIKRSMVVVPVVLFIFLAISVFWVPNTEAVSTNAGRKNRLIFYMGANPEDMNPWTSTSASDGDIYDYFFEGLVHYSKMYQLEPWLAESVVVGDEVTSFVPDGMTRDEFKQAIRDEFGDQVKDITDAKGPKIGDPDDDMKAKLKEAGLTGMADDIKKQSAKIEAVKVQFSTAPVKGKIVSAVVPDFQERLEKRLGHKLFPQADPEAVAAKSYDSLPDAVKKITSKEQIAQRIRDLLDSMGFEPVRHSPDLDCHIRHGIYWTDGPFFTDPAHTWLVSCDDDEVGNVVADTREQAIKQVSDQLAKDGIKGKFSARTYDKRFGTDDGGPWWGRGPELKARDAKLTYDLVKDPVFASPRRSSYMSIKDIEIDPNDPYRVKFVYDGLYSPAVSDIVGSILPYHVWNRKAWAFEAAQRGNSAADMEIPVEKYNPMAVLVTKDRDFMHHPSYLGSMLLQPLNGKELPYWQPNQRVRLRRNEFYWNRKPEYQFVDYLVFDPKYGAETAEQAFLGGDMDVYGAESYQVPRYERMTDDYYVIKRQTLTYAYIGFNLGTPQLKDKRVRLALSMAIDVDEIINYVLFQQGERISGPNSPVVPWYDNNFHFTHKWRTGPKAGKTEELKFVPYNMEEARALLIEAGFHEQGGQMVDSQGKPLTLNFRNGQGNPNRHNIAMLAKEKWTQLGVVVNYDEYEWNDFIRRIINPGDFDACVLGWQLGLDFDQRQLWSSKNTPPNGLNFINYSNPKADKLMEDILNVYDYDKQVKVSHEIFDTIAADFPYIFLYSGLATTIVDKHIVWRKQVGTDAQGKPILKDTPLTDPEITGAKASWRYWEPELLRREEIPDTAKAK